MTLRIFLFITLLFIGVTSLAQWLQWPIDGFLAALLVSALGVILTFAHYRHIGRQRSRGNTHSALRHLWWWQLLLPGETYHQLRLQILVESEDPEAARQAIAQAQTKNLLDLAFITGFRAEVERRMGHYQAAESALIEGLRHTPPGLLRAGLQSQLARLYIHHITSSKTLETAESLLEEADTFVDTHVHSLLIQAIRGELYLAQKDPNQAAQLLQHSLDQLLASHPPPPGIRVSWWVFLRYFFQGLLAQLTYSQQDEHQNPFYAELCLSLGKAYLACRNSEKAKQAIQCGLSLCQQPFIYQPLRELQRSL